MLKNWLTDTKTPTYFLQTNDLPIIDIKLNFKAGSIFNGEKLGLSDLAVGMFATETLQSNEETLINRTTDLGISINSNSNKQFFTVTIRLLNEKNIITESLKLISEIFSMPSFNENIFNREKSQTLTHILYREQHPAYLASLEFNKLLYNDTPYIYPTLGTKDSVNSITINDVKDFYNEYICQENLNIVIVGNIDKSQANEIANTITNSLPKNKKNIITFTPKKATTQIIKKRFDSKQTCILTGHQLFENPTSELYFPLTLANIILGGSGLGSRLFNKVREELGLVYNISSNMNFNQHYGSFIISAQTSNPNLAFETINNVYKDFIENEISKEDIQNAKKYKAGTHLIGSVKNSSKLAMSSIVANSELPLDFFETYISKLNKVTYDDIKESFKKIKHNEFVTAMIGNIDEN